MQKPRYLTAARIGLLALAFLALAYGVFRGGYLPVLYKAARVCLECIGIG